jgi:hypothetical protein
LGVQNAVEVLLHVHDAQNSIVDVAEAASLE